jgi:hypothetical protein
MPPNWPRPLKRTRGSRQRLLGVRVYYDFRWGDFFGDRRVQFKNGLALARLAVAECPAGKVPALLLTDDSNASERPITTDEEFVLVVRLPEYIHADNDVAASYYAHRFASAVTGIAQIRDILDSPALSQALVQDHLDESHIREWVNVDPGRLDMLASILNDAATADMTLDRLAETVRLMAEVDPSVWSNLVALLPQLVEHETFPALLAAITNDRLGRAATSESIASRLLERLQDVRVSAAGYQQLLDDPRSNEVDLQRYIENHPWLIGLDYSRVRARRDVPRGSLDFVLERFDGFHDLLELKSPGDSIIDAPDAMDDVGPSASAYSLSRALANALAQVHVYRDTLTAHESTVEQLYGLAHSRDPRIVIVIGQVRNLPAHRRRVLEQLNRSLHRVEVIPYDVIGRRAEAWVRAIERYLDAPQSLDEPE